MPVRRRTPVVPASACPGRRLDVTTVSPVPWTPAWPAAAVNSRRRPRAPMGTQAGRPMAMWRIPTASHRMIDRPLRWVGPGASTAPGMPMPPWVPMPRRMSRPTQAYRPTPARVRTPRWMRRLMRPCSRTHKAPPTPCRTPSTVWTGRTPAMPPRRRFKYAGEPAPARSRSRPLHRRALGSAFWERHCCLRVVGGERVRRSRSDVTLGHDPCGPAALLSR